MTPPQPQQHCDHECVCCDFPDDIVAKQRCPRVGCKHDTRSRPATTPEPDWMKGYPPEMRAWAEACNIGAEEQYIQEQRAEAAAQAREEVLEEFPVSLKDCHKCTLPCTHVGKDAPFETRCPKFYPINTPYVGEIHIRKSVMEFALLMEIKLRKNDHKSHWSKESFTYLFGRLDDERKELDKEVARQTSDYEKIINECVDEADFLMMIVDNLQSLRTNSTTEAHPPTIEEFPDSP